MEKKLQMTTFVVLFLVFAVSTMLFAQEYLEPEYPPTLQPGPFPLGTEEERGDAPVDINDPNEVIHEYTAYKGTVTVDGDLSDPAWVAIPWTLMEFNRDIPTSQEGSLWDPDYAPENYDGWEDMSTWFKMIHDDENVYVALFRYDDDNSWVEGTDVDDGNIWQNDAYQVIIDMRYPGENDEEMPGTEFGLCLVSDLEVYHFWDSGQQNPGLELPLAEGDCASGLPSTDGKAVRGVSEGTDDGFKEMIEAAFVKYDDMDDDMVGMLSVCALDRDYDLHESVNQWAQGLFVKTPDEYGSVLWSPQSVPTAVESKVNATPKTFVLRQNYPNPFNPSTTISYSLAKQERVVLKVFDINGGEVKTLVNKAQNAGEYAITFDASALSSGVYLYQLQAGSQVLTRKMSLLR